MARIWCPCGLSTVLRHVTCNKLRAGCRLTECPDIYRLQNETGWTPLHEAACNGRLQVAQTLLKLGADLHKRTSEGDTALHKAARWGRPDLVKLLLVAGADARARDKVSIFSTAQAQLFCLSITNAQAFDCQSCTACTRELPSSSVPEMIQKEQLCCRILWFCICPYSLYFSAVKEKRHGLFCTSNHPLSLLLASALPGKQHYAILCSKHCLILPTQEWTRFQNVDGMICNRFWDGNLYRAANKYQEISFGFVFPSALLPLGGWFGCLHSSSSFAAWKGAPAKNKYGRDQRALESPEKGADGDSKWDPEQTSEPDEPQTWSSCAWRKQRKPWIWLFHWR